MRCRALLFLFVVILVFTTQSLPVAAQSEPPPPIPGDALVERDGEGRYYSRGDESPVDAAALEALAASAPDQFGHTWSTVPLNWIDATGGVDTGMHGDSANQAYGPVALPFPFKFYEFTYTSLTIVAPGYLSFLPLPAWDDQFRLKSPIQPNNIIVPYASPIDLSGNGQNGRVFYASGGTAPNRYFVVEWHNVRGADQHNDHLYLFEVVLFENGDIVFNYKTMNTPNGYWCGTSGIENVDGSDGLISLPFCAKPAAPKAVRFTRGAAQGRVQVYPLVQGRFSQAAVTEVFDFEVRNTGELGTDRYNVASQPTGRATFTFPNGVPLSDSDGDGKIDTGPIGALGRKMIRAAIRMPAVANPATSFSAKVVLTSARSPATQRTVNLGLGVPAPFAQIYGLNMDNGLKVLTAQPTLVKGSTLPAGRVFDDIAIVSLPGAGYFAAWYEFSARGAVSYVFLDETGQPRSPKRTLALPPTAGADTFAWYPALAVAGDGRIAIAWHDYRQRWENGVVTHSNNLAMAIVDGSGNIVMAPQRLTNHTQFVRSSTAGYVDIDSPTVAAVAGNRFVIAWATFEDLTDDDWVANVDYSVRSSSGGTVLPVTRFSSAPERDKDYAVYPSLNTLASGDAFLMWSNRDIRYAKLSNAGALLAGPFSLPHNDLSEYGPTSAQLAGGDILTAWYASWNGVGIIQYALIDGASLTPQAGPTRLAIADDIGAQAPSIAPDASGNGIITWLAGLQDHIAGAVVNGAGAIVVPPQAFVNLSLDEYMAGREMNLRWPAGYANAPFSAQPSSTMADPVLSASSTGGPQGGQALFEFDLQNRGLETATNLTLQAQLDPALTFVSSQPPPTTLAASATGGGTVSWEMGDIGFLGGGSVRMLTTVPSTTVGATWPVTLTLTSSAAVQDPSHGQAQATAMEMNGHYLPRVAK